jgi:Fe2+ transport system protein FeoA
MNIPLPKLQPGQSARVIEVRSSDPARLGRLGAYGLVPGSLVCLKQNRPALILCLGETEVAIDDAVGSEIIVQPGT